MCFGGAHQDLKNPSQAVIFIDTITQPKGLVFAFSLAQKQAFSIEKRLQ
jgi:hypothetical protein